MTGSVRENILKSIIEIKNKNDNTIIPIIKTELLFESSKYSSIKKDIWHVCINDNKIKKNTNYVFFYECLHCRNINSCGSTQILRKIRQCKTMCFQCNNIHLNETNYDRTIKIRVEKEEKTYRQKFYGIFRKITDCLKLIALVEQDNRD
jgi:hypothetical protein